MSPISSLVVIAALSLGASIAHAQQPATAPPAAAPDAPTVAVESGATPARAVRFGARIGLNMAHVVGDAINEDAVKNRSGLAIGGFVHLRLAPSFALEPGLAFAQKGSSVKSLAGGGTQKLDYLQAPVLAVGLIPVSPTVALRAFGGASLSLLVASEWEQGGGSADTVDDTRPFDVGLILGAGADVTLPAGLLIFDLRYELGLLTVDDHGNDIRQRVLSANAGFGF